MSMTRIIIPEYSVDTPNNILPLVATADRKKKKRKGARTEINKVVIDSRGNKFS